MVTATMSARTQRGASTMDQIKPGWANEITSPIAMPTVNGRRVSILNQVRKLRDPELPDVPTDEDQCDPEFEDLEQSWLQEFLQRNAK